MRTNQLPLNVNFVIFRPRQISLPFIPSLTLFDDFNKLKEIYYKDCIKFLGVLIDMHQSWRQHINYISLKISRAIGITPKLRHYVPQEIFSKVYKTLINPYLYYGIC